MWFPFRMQRLCAVAWTVMTVTLTVGCSEMSPWSVSDCSVNGDPQLHPISYYDLRLLILKNLRQMTTSLWLIIRGSSTHSDDWCGLESGILYQVKAQTSTSNNFTFIPPEPNSLVHCHSEYLQLEPNSYGFVSCAEKRHDVAAAVDRWWNSLPFAYTLEVGVAVGVVVGVAAVVGLGLWVRKRRRTKGQVVIGS